MTIKEGVQFICISKNRTLLAFCFLFIAGVGSASLMNTRPTQAIVIGFILWVLLVFILVKWQKNETRFVALAGFFFLLGVWRVMVAEVNCASPNAVCFYNGNLVEIIGTIIREPDRRVDKTNYVVEVSNLGGGAVRGAVLVSYGAYPRYDYGDTIQILCRLEAPTASEDSTFRYDKYLAKEGISTLCQKTTIQNSVSKEKTLSQKAFGSILHLKSTLDRQVGRLWVEPDSSLVAGILYGSRSGLPFELKEAFSATGITHIIAVSGFNITIIASLLMTIGIRSGLWRRQAFWMVVVSVWLFVVLVGLSASAVRAAIMGTIVILGERLGRPLSIGTVLVFTASLMLLHNPLVLLYDAGFQLSFLATLGLVYISPLINHKINLKTPSDLTRAISESFAVTLSAIIATLPLMLFQFGTISLVALPANLIVVPIIPWIMLASFVSVLASVVFFPLGQAVALLTSFGLQYVIRLATFFGSVPGSTVSITIPWWAMVISYLVVVWYVQRKSKSL
jgi:competence protein ComEC